MSRRNSRVPGMVGRRSFAIPRCSVHRTPCVRGADRQFVCPDCMTDFMKPKGKTGGGVELPSGVEDERVLTFHQLLPNRRARRAVMRP